MLAVAGIDDGAVHLLAQQLDRPRVRVPHDQNVRVHGVQRHCRVDQRFALFDGTGGDRHVDDVATEALARQFERCARSRRVLEKQVDDGAPAQNGLFLVGLTVLLDIALGTVEKSGNFNGIEALDTEEMLVWKAECTGTVVHRRALYVRGGRNRKCHDQCFAERDGMA